MQSRSGPPPSCLIQVYPSVKRSLSYLSLMVNDFSPSSWRHFAPNILNPCCATGWQISEQRCRQQVTFARRCSLGDNRIFFARTSDKTHIRRDLLLGADAKCLRFIKKWWAEEALHSKEPLQCQEAGGKPGIVCCCHCWNSSKRRSRKIRHYTTAAINSRDFSWFSPISVLSMFNPIFKQLYWTKQTTICPDSWLRRSSWLIPCQQSWPYAESRTVAALLNNISRVRLLIFSAL